MTWSKDELRKIGEADDLHIALIVKSANPDELCWSLAAPRTLAETG